MADGVATEPEAPAPATAAVSKRIELLPNCSLSPGDARRLFAFVAATSLAIAGLFVASGYWPVLPFAGLELALLAFALTASVKRRHYLETIEISEADITITSRGPGGILESRFSRHWARVTLRGPRGWQPSRLVIESHGRACEIGSFLTEEERRALRRRLTALVGRTSDSPALAAGDDGSAAGSE
jgi:uncharacterized membrane protein